MLDFTDVTFWPPSQAGSTSGILLAIHVAHDSRKAVAVLTSCLCLSFSTEHKAKVMLITSQQYHCSQNTVTGSQLPCPYIKQILMPT